MSFSDEHDIVLVPSASELFHWPTGVAVAVSLACSTNPVNCLLDGTSMTTVNQTAKRLSDSLPELNSLPH